MKIVYAEPSYFQSFHKALDSVAREEIYIEMTQAHELERLATYQKKLIENDLPTYYAVEGRNVVGWIDISTGSSERTAHRGHLGMGLIKGYRGKGLGSNLLKTAIDHAKDCGMEKIELTVYVDNLPAIALYKKFGFEQTGLIRHYRRLNGRYFDAMTMEKFI